MFSGAFETFSVPERLRCARAHWKSGDADKAARCCEEVLAEWPGQADALHLLGLIASASGDFDLAIDRLRQACLPPRVPAVYSSNLADVCRRKGLLAEAEAAARWAVTVDPNLVPGWNTLGMILQESGNLDESRACLERVVTLKPRWAEGHNNLGNAYRRLGMLHFAAWHYVVALTLDRDCAEPHYNLALVHTAQGEYKEAAIAARRAIELDPRLADAYVSLAEAEMALHRYAAALEALNALRAFAPEHAAGLAMRGRAIEQIERSEGALGLPNDR